MKSLADNWAPVFENLCRDRAKFTDKEDAVYFLSEIIRIDYDSFYGDRVYECPDCKSWHIGR